MPNENMALSESYDTNIVFEEISNHQTPKRNLMLQTLYERNGVRVNHKDLATSMGLTIHALSNLIAKMELLGYISEDGGERSHAKVLPSVLVEVEKEGRNKYYTLTDLGNGYVEWSKKKASNLYAVENQAQIGVIKVLNMIKELKDEMDDWEEALYSWLTQVNSSGGNESHTSFQSLLDEIACLYEQPNGKKMELILHEFENPMVQKKVIKYVQENLRKEEVFELMTDRERAYGVYQLVADFFKPYGLTQLSDLIARELPWFKEEETFRILVLLSEIVTESRKQKLSHEMFCRKWDAKFSENRDVLTQIADGYDKMTVTR